MQQVKRFAVLGAVVLATFSLDGAAQAQQVQQLYACVNNSSGTIKMVAPGTVCSDGATLFSWNTQGPIGPQGPAGPQGPQGPAGLQPFSQYTCSNQGLLSGSPINFTPTGVSGGGGVGNNTSTSFTFVLQEGTYLILLDTRALFTDDVSNSIVTQGTIVINLDGIAQQQFSLVGAIPGLFVNTATSGHHVLSVTGPNRTLWFTINGVLNTASKATLLNCYLTLFKLQ